MYSPCRLTVRIALILALLAAAASLALAQAPPPPPVWHAPTLVWAGLSGYAADGVQPELGRTKTAFVFKVKYKHQDNIPAQAVKVAIKGPSGYALAGSPFTMVGSGSTTWVAGVVFSLELKLNLRGTYAYRFTADDGLKTAALPASGFVTGPVVDSPPVLAFAGITGYTADGVGPDTGPVNSTFVFRVKYSQADGAAPTSVALRLWDPTGKEVTGSPLAMSTGATSPDYKAGVVYWRGVILRLVGVYSYQFTASDGLRSVTFPAARASGPRVTAAP